MIVKLYNPQIPSHYEQHKTNFTPLVIKNNNSEIKTVILKLPSLRMQLVFLDRCVVRHIVFRKR